MFHVEPDKLKIFCSTWNKIFLTKTLTNVPRGTLVKVYQLCKFNNSSRAIVPCGTIDKKLFS